MVVVGGGGGGVHWKGFLSLTHWFLTALFNASRVCTHTHTPKPNFTLWENTYPKHYYNLPHFFVCGPQKQHGGSCVVRRDVIVGASG